MINTRLAAAAMAALLIVGISAATPAFGMGDQTLDGNHHPSVGFIFAQQSDPSTCAAEVVANCAATLIAPTVAVTSGGCADILINAHDYGYDLSAIWISFNPDVPFDCATASRVASIQFHPDFVENVAPSPFDIGVLLLASPAPQAPASLPAAGSAGGLLRGDDVDVVTWMFPEGGGVFLYRRTTASASVLSSDDDYLKLKRAPPSGQICGGLEGGGVFLPGGQDLAALIINTGGGSCKVAPYLRLDTAVARDFLADFVTLP